MKSKINAICPLCWGSTYSPEGSEEICGFCNSELCATSFYEPLDTFLKKHTLESLENDLQKQKMKLKATHWWKDRDRRFYTKDFLYCIRRVIKLKKAALRKEWLKKHLKSFLKR